MGPLEGIRVLDLSMVVSGPFCTMMLGDLGADVIKIEPPEGDVVADRCRAGRGGVAVGILNWNRNKRAMMLDLKQPGRAPKCFCKMAEHADVVVQNVRPGVVDRLGVGYEAVAARNPKIVYCSIAGYGFSGPVGQQARVRSDHPGHGGRDDLAAHAGPAARGQKYSRRQGHCDDGGDLDPRRAQRGAAQRQGTASEDRDDRRGRLLPDGRHRVATYFSAARARSRRPR